MESAHKNSLGQPIGFPTPNWQPAKHPDGSRLDGHFCWLERMDPAKHASSLYEIQSRDEDHRRWTYMGYGPFESYAAYHAWMTQYAGQNDPLFYAVIDRQDGQAVGVASLMRTNLTFGSIEVGHINFSGRMQRQPAGTNAIYLLMRHIFDDLGFRRFEWKCDALNAPSRKAALRYGFSFEGIFRQHLMYKGRNRDTAWFSILDHEWPSLKHAFEIWLSPKNFDENGQQRQRFEDLRN